MVKKLLRSVKNLSWKIGGFYAFRLTDFASVLGSQFSVPVGKCHSAYGFSFEATREDHPLIVLLKEHKRHANLRYENSSIRAFLHKFNPQNLQEALFGRVFDPQCRTAKIMPIVPFNGDITVPYLPMPWSTRIQVLRYKKKALRIVPNKWQDVEAHARKEFVRTISVYESLKCNGYQPALFSDGSLTHRFIQAVILRKNEEERFIIMSGHHRVAALSVLGWEEISVIPVINDLPIVDAANAENWPVVQEDVYDLVAAHRVLGRFFSQAA